MPDTEKLKEEICEAIAARRVIQFRYNGKARVVEPFVCGASAANKYIFRGFQTGGESSSGRKMGWRLFEVANVGDLEITSIEFSGYGGDRRLYNPRDPAMRQIFCSVRNS